MDAILKINGSRISGYPILKTNPINKSVALFMDKNKSLLIVDGRVIYTTHIEDDGVVYPIFFDGELNIRNSDSQIKDFIFMGKYFHDFPFIMDSNKERSSMSVLFLSEHCGMFLSVDFAYKIGQVVDALRSCFDEEFWKPSKSFISIKN